MPSMTDRIGVPRFPHPLPKPAAAPKPAAPKPAAPIPTGSAPSDPRIPQNPPSHSQSSISAPSAITSLSKTTTCSNPTPSEALCPNPATTPDAATTSHSPAPSSTLGNSPDSATAATPDQDLAPAPALPDLTPLQQQAIDCLIDGMNFTQTSAVLHIDRKTLFEWRQLPHFSAAYDAAFKQRLADVAQRRQLLLEPAARTLYTYLASPNVGLLPAARLALGILNSPGLRILGRSPSASLHPQPAAQARRQFYDHFPKDPYAIKTNATAV